MLNFIKKRWNKWFPCQHSWVHPSRFVHNEDHGIDWYRRYCEKCGKRQFKVYHRYGEYRYSWADYPDLGIKDE